MAGTRTDQKKLNHTLEVVANILHEENINDWFIFYGTLLGIVRENSCIQGDDDLDIMINCDYQQLRSAFEKKGFTFMEGKYGIKNPDTILKSKPTQEFGSFDFYMCNVNESGDFYTPWEQTWLRNAYEDKKVKSFEVKKWRSTFLQLPHNPEDRLSLMYGDWQVPRSRVKVGSGKDIS